MDGLRSLCWKLVQDHRMMLLAAAAKPHKLVGYITCRWCTQTLVIICQYFTNNTNNNNNNDNVYGAVIMTMVTSRVHPVHLMNADWAPSGRQPSDQANQLGLWVCLLSSTIHIHHHNLLLLLSLKANTHFIVPQRVEGWVNLGTAGRVRSPCSRLYIAVAVVINILAAASHPAVSHATTKPLLHAEACGCEQLA